MNILGIFVLFVFPMIATIPVTSLLCHRRLSRQKRVSYGTVFMSAFCVPVFLALIATCMEPNMWWSRDNKNDPVAWRMMLLFMVAMCVLPAFFVALYYQRRSNKALQATAAAPIVSTEP